MRRRLAAIVLALAGSQCPDAMAGGPEALADAVEIAREPEVAAPERLRRALAAGPRPPPPARPASPEQYAALAGRRLTELVAPARIRKVFVPAASAGVADAAIHRALAAGRVVDPDDLTPMHLRPCARLVATTTDERTLERCLFETPDDRGVLTLPDRTRLCALVIGQRRFTWDPDHEALFSPVTPGGRLGFYILPEAERARWMRRRSAR
jgi:hypothetical protein